MHMIPSVWGQHWEADSYLQNRDKSFARVMFMPRSLRTIDICPCIRNSGPLSDCFELIITNCPHLTQWTGECKRLLGSDDQKSSFMYQIVNFVTDCEWSGFSDLTSLNKGNINRRFRIPIHVMAWVMRFTLTQEESLKTSYTLSIDIFRPMITIDSGNGLSSAWYQAIAWINDDFVKWSPRNKLQWNMVQNWKIFIRENAFEFPS